MNSRETESIWKALHEELSGEEQRDFKASLAMNPDLRAEFDEATRVHEALKLASTSEAAWLENMTQRITEEIDNEQNPNSLSLLRHNVAQWVALAALFIFGFFSFTLWDSSPTLSWEHPEMVASEFRGDLNESGFASEGALKAWHTSFQAEVNDLYAKESPGGQATWSLALSFQAVDEGVSVEVKAEQAESLAPVLSWTFFAADFETLESSLKLWAETVIGGIVANDP